MSRGEEMHSFLQSTFSKIENIVIELSKSGKQITPEIITRELMQSGANITYTGGLLILSNIPIVRPGSWTGAGRYSLLRGDEMDVVTFNFMQDLLKYSIVEF